MRQNDPKNYSEFFDLMPPETRERVLGQLKKFAWDFATATACGYSKEGRMMPSPPREVGQSVSDAMLEVLFGMKGAQDFKLYVEKAIEDKP